MGEINIILFHQIKISKPWTFLHGRRFLGVAKLKGDHVGLVVTNARQGDEGYFYFYRASRSTSASRSTRLIRREDSMRGVVCPCRK